MRYDSKGLAEGVLFTDLYELTMAQLYFRMGIHEREAQFEHFFRTYPDYGGHKAGYCINAGLEWLLDWMQNASFGSRELRALRRQKDRSGKPLFSEDFLNWLNKHGNFDGITMRAVPEGRAVHPNVPLTVVEGPFAMAQILESSLLNHLNYQTLIATKAARIREAGQKQLTIEFGMRRAQEKGANAGARAALIGGADFTSNTGISCALGYRPKGTHAHSMVEAFIAIGEDELSAFRAYAEVYPDDCVLLVDTVDTLNSGLPNAIKVFEELKRKGHKPVGIRLDSGDLAYLSIQAAKMLNDAGFDDVAILLSNQLDEMVIWQVISQIKKEASVYGVDPGNLIDRLAYGVGTSLITSKGCAALDGVYKLTAFKDGGDWMPAIKVSENPAKTINPGIKNAYRIYDRRQKAVTDLICLQDENPEGRQKINMHHCSEENVHRVMTKKEVSKIEPLLVSVLDEGKQVCDTPEIEQIRQIRDDDLQKLDSGVKRLINPHVYHVSLSEKLWKLKKQLIDKHTKNLQQKAKHPK